MRIECAQMLEVDFPAGENAPGPARFIFGPTGCRRCGPVTAARVAKAQKGTEVGQIGRFAAQLGTKHRRLSGLVETDLPGEVCAAYLRPQCR